MTVKIVRYESLFYIGFTIGICFMIISSILNLTRGEFALTALICFLVLLLARHFCMGKFRAHEFEHNKMAINWIRKPLLSKYEDFEFDLLDIKEVTVDNGFFNNSFAPDKFNFQTYSGKGLSFHIPVFVFNNQFQRFENILNGTVLISKQIREKRMKK